MSSSLLVFGLLVFLAVFSLSQGLVVPVFGEARRVRKRLEGRLAAVAALEQRNEIANLVREKYLKELSPLQRRLESLPGMPRLARMIEQAGHSVLAHRLVLLSLVLAVCALVIVWTLLRMPAAAIMAGLIVGWAPYVKIMRDRNRRMQQFEEQMPEAIDVVRRALQAGHPFSATLKLVAEDMQEPIAGEFSQTFADISYGNDVRRAMLGLLERIPSVTVMAFVTSVLVQKETGGNLAEILEQIAKVIRGRFRFHRKVRTLSAEGRLSAWVLAMVPLVMFAIISLTTPEYLPVLFDDPLGKKLVSAAFVMGVLGVWWIRRIIRIDA
jgi:tight adherence protein B